MIPLVKIIKEYITSYHMHIIYAYHLYTKLSFITLLDFNHHHYMHHIIIIKILFFLMYPERKKSFYIHHFRRCFITTSVSTKMRYHADTLFDILHLYSKFGKNRIIAIKWFNFSISMNCSEIFC